MEERENLAPTGKKRRYPLLDFLRGTAIFSMVLYHLLYDIYVIGGANPDWPGQPSIMLWQRLGLWLFVLVGGMSCALMRDGARWQYGLRLNLLGLAITAATVIFMPAEAIYFGVLNFFGCALWLTALLENDGRRLLSRLGGAAMPACLLGAAVLNRPAAAAVSMGGLELWRWPRWLQQDALAWLGFHSGGFASADYVPLLPHIFIFWLGFYLLGRLRKHRPAWLQAGDWRPVTLPGRHTLLIYLLHQPVLLGLLRGLGVVDF